MAMPQSVLAVFALAALLAVPGVNGHGTVSKPIPRKLKSASWCPWCVGEHHAGNPYGKSHLSAKPSTPCIGTTRSDPPYPIRNFGGQKEFAEEGPKAYVAGQPFDATIYLNADHFGVAQWSLCPHSEPETEKCFAKNPLTEWIDVHAYWGNDEKDHAGDAYPETVNLPETAPVGRVTLRWLWVCRYTDELFASCIDVDVVAPDGSAPSPTPAPITMAPTPEPVEPQPEPKPEPEPTLAPAPTPAPTPVGVECSKSWQQCGGKTWTGPTCCEADLKCDKKGDHYHQCVPVSASMIERLDSLAAPCGHFRGSGKMCL